MNSTETPATTFHGIVLTGTGTAHMLTYLSRELGSVRPAENVEWFTDKDALDRRVNHLTGQRDRRTGAAVNTDIRVDTIH
jgi:hypothetical protein